MKTLVSYEHHDDLISHGHVWTFAYSDGSVETTRDAQHAEQILRDHHAPKHGELYNAEGNHL